MLITLCNAVTLAAIATAAELTIGLALSLPLSLSRSIFLLGVVQVAELTTDSHRATFGCCVKCATTALPILMQQGAHGCNRAILGPWQQFLELFVWDVLVLTAVFVESLLQLHCDRVLANLFRAACGYCRAASFSLFHGLAFSLRLGLSRCSGCASQLRIPWAEMAAYARLSVFAALFPVVLAWQLAGKRVPHTAQRRSVFC